jgi:hypothetical protein
MKKTVMMLVLAGFAVNAFAQYGQKDSTGLPGMSSNMVGDYGILPYAPTQPVQPPPAADSVQVQCFGRTFTVPTVGVAYTFMTPASCGSCVFINGVLSSYDPGSCGGNG